MGIVEKFEEKYYAFLDALEAKGIPVYKIIDPIENAGIRSWMVIVALLVIIFAGVIGSMLGITAGFTVTVQGTGGPIQYATVTVIQDKEILYEIETGSDGKARFPALGEVEIDVTVKGCTDTARESVDTEAQTTLQVTLKCATALPGGCSNIAQEHGTALIVGESGEYLKGCKITILSDIPQNTSWGVDGNTLYLDSSACIGEEDPIEIVCIDHYGTFTLDQLKQQLTYEGKIIVPVSEFSTQNKKDTDGDGIIDDYDEDSDNDGIADLEDDDMDGDGIPDIEDNDVFGVDATELETITKTVTLEDGTTVTIETIADKAQLALARKLFNCPDCVPPKDYAPFTGVHALLETPTGAQLVARTVYSTHVKTISTEGAVAGVTISAVDRKGKPLVTQYSNVKLLGVTDENGKAVLVLPYKEEYYLKAEDTNDVYGPTMTNKYIQTDSKEVSMTLSKAAKTTVNVKNAASGRAVSYAQVQLFDAGVLMAEDSTDSSGEAVVALENGKSFTVTVTKQSFVAAKTSVTGGSGTEVQLTQIDSSNSGALKVTVVNGEGILEPFTNARLEVIDSQGIVVRDCVTSAKGECTFERLFQGSYSFALTAPDSTEPETGFSMAQVIAGGLREVELLATPGTAGIDIATKVDGIPMEEVSVELYDTTYGTVDQLESERSGEDRHVHFEDIYLGKMLYFTAWFEDGGEKYYYSQPVFRHTQNLKLEIDLRSVSEHVEFKVKSPGNDITKEKMYTGVLEIDLPFADEQKQESYEKVTAEVWIGEPGEKINPVKTPMLFSSIDPYEYALQVNPRISVTAADEINLEKEATGRGNPTGTSKYLQFILTDYNTPASFDLELPVFARSTASGDAVVNYRATWETEDGKEITSNEGGWEEVSYNIVGGTSTWNFVEDEYFNGYKAWLSETPDDDTGMAELEITQGSHFYLHVRALAGDESDNYEFNLDTLPVAGRTAIRLAGYNGIIEHADGTEREILPVEKNSLLKTAFSPPRDGDSTRYKVFTDDIVEVTMTLVAEEPISDGELIVFGDQDSTLKLDIIEAEESQQTSIANVIATIKPQARICPGVGYTIAGGALRSNCKDLSTRGNLGEYKFDEVSGLTPERVIPSYSLSRLSLFDGPRWIQVEVKLYNSGDAAQTALLNVQADGLTGIVAPTSVAIPAKSTKTIKIKGKGTDPTKNNKIDLYLWQAGTSEPDEPWVTLWHGPVDYEFQVTPLMDGKESLEESDLNVATEEVMVRLVRKDLLNEGGSYITTGVETGGVADAIEVKLPIDGSLVEETCGLVSTEGGDKYFTTGAILDALDGDGTLVVKATHPEFGTLEKRVAVHDTDVTKTNGGWHTLSAPYPQTKIVNIANNWDEELTVEVNKDVIAKGTKWQHDDIFNQELFVKTNVMTERVELTSSSRTYKLQPGGWLRIFISADPVGSECNNYESENKIVFSMSTADITKTTYQTSNFKCDWGTSGGETPVPVASDVVVTRESTNTYLVGPDSCSLTVNAEGEAEAAVLCDAEQLAAAILLTADDLKDSGELSDSKLYAFGKDVLTAESMNDIAMFHPNGPDTDLRVTGSAVGASDGDLVYAGDEIECGSLSVHFTKISGGAIEMTVTPAEGSPAWCDSSKGQYALALLNYDGYLRERELGNNWYAFKDGLSEYEQSTLVGGDYPMFIDYIPVESEIFGSVSWYGRADYNLLLDAETEAIPIVVFYAEFENDAGNIGNRRLAAGLGWIDSDKDGIIDDAGETRNVGFYRLRDDDHFMSFGIAYKDDDNLEFYRTCFVENIVDYWQTGVIAGGWKVKGNNPQNGLIFDLDKCVSKQRGDAPEVSVTILTQKPVAEWDTGTEIEYLNDVDQVIPIPSGSKMIGVQLGVSKSAVACEVWTGADLGSKNVVYKADSAWHVGVDEDLVLLADYEIFDGSDANLAGESYYINSRCRTDLNVWSPTKRRTVVVDTKPPEIVVDEDDLTGVMTSGTTPILDFDVSDLQNIKECTIEQVCPVNMDGSCDLGSSTNDILKGYVYGSAWCRLPEMSPISGEGSACKESGKVDVELVCTDFTENKGVFEYAVEVLAANADDPTPIWSCGNDRGSPGQVASMKTRGDYECLEYDTASGAHPFIASGSYYYVDTQDIIIPIRVTSTGKVSGCTIKRSSGTPQACKVNDAVEQSDFDRQYLCETAKGDGTYIIGKDAKNTVTVTCSAAGKTGQSKDFLINVDTDKPGTNLYESGSNSEISSNSINCWNGICLLDYSGSDSDNWDSGIHSIEYDCGTAGSGEAIGISAKGSSSTNRRSCPDYVMSTNSDQSVSVTVTDKVGNTRQKSVLVKNIEAQDFKVWYDANEPSIYIGDFNTCEGTGYSDKVLVYQLSACAWTNTTQTGNDAIIVRVDGIPADEKIETHSDGDQNLYYCTSFMNFWPPRKINRVQVVDPLSQMDRIKVIVREVGVTSQTKCL